MSDKSTTVSKPKLSKSKSKDVLNIIKQEMGVLETTLAKLCLLEKRCFSAVGLFVKKMRTSLKDDTIYMLSFLREYILQNSR